MAEPRIKLPTLKPRKYQRRYMEYFDDGGKRRVSVWHRRAGKDLTALNQTNKMAHETSGLYWHCLPTYEQGRKAIWNGFTRDGSRILDLIFPEKLCRRRNEQQMFVELKHNGSIIQIVGSDNIDNLVGTGPRGVNFSEYSLSKPSAWNLVRPILRENGGWASFIYTPRGLNHGWDLAQTAKKTKGWEFEALTIKDTNLRYLDPRDDSETPRLVGWEEIVQFEREEGMPEELIQQEYFADFTAALVGSYYGEFVAQMDRTGRLQAWDHERDGVYMSTDLGIKDSTAIWWWRLSDKGDGIELLDYYEAHSKGLEHYYKVIREKREKHGFKYVRLWLPHDAKARTLQTGVSTIQLVEEEFRGDIDIGITPGMLVQDGIQAARWMLAKPGSRIHPRCDDKDGIAALRQYHREWDEDKRVFKATPEHDWSSHGADALRYISVVVKLEKLLTYKEPVEKPKAVVVPVAEPFNLEQLFEDYLRDIGEM